MTAALAVTLVAGCGGESLDVPSTGAPRSRATMVETSAPTPTSTPSTVPPRESGRTWNPDRIATITPYGPEPVRAWLLQQVHNSPFFDKETYTDAQYLEFMQQACRELAAEDLSNYGEDGYSGSEAIIANMQRRTGLQYAPAGALAGWAMLGLCPEETDRRANAVDN